MAAGYVRNRLLTVTADNANNQSAFCNCQSGGVVTVRGVFVATCTLQRRGTDGNIVDVTDNTGAVITYTAPGTYSLNPQMIAGDYRLNVKSGAFTSGTFNGMIEGK